MPRWRAGLRERALKQGSLFQGGRGDPTWGSTGGKQFFPLSGSAARQARALQGRLEEREDFSPVSPKVAGEKWLGLTRLMLGIERGRCIAPMFLAGSALRAGEHLAPGIS